MAHRAGGLSGLAELFLRPSGWQRSLEEGRPVRANGTPVPWFTFGAVEFLHRIVRPSDRVFEYGAGYSTLWFQRMVQKVESVDHDQQWCKILRPQLDNNVTLRHVGASAACPPSVDHVLRRYYRRPHRTEWPDYSADKITRRGLADQPFHGYAAAITVHEYCFDIIVIDGMARRLCTEFAVEKLANDGTIIFDNSNRSDYDAAYDILEEANFAHVPIWGLVPGAEFFTCTSFFLKTVDRLPRAGYVPNTMGLPEN